jgi:hypothetical protein
MNNDHAAYAELLQLQVDPLDGDYAQVIGESPAISYDTNRHAVYGLHQGHVVAA